MATNKPDTFDAPVGIKSDGPFMSVNWCDQCKSARGRMVKQETGEPAVFLRDDERVRT
jgi:hypothetical protein